MDENQTGGQSFEQLALFDLGDLEIMSTPLGSAIYGKDSGEPVILQSMN